MDNEPASDSLIRNYLEMNETELLIAIGRMRSEGPELRSPDALISEVREFLTRQRANLRNLICPHADFVDLPEYELAVAIAGLLTNSFALPLAAALAAYISKRGLKELCEAKAVHE